MKLLANENIPVKSILYLRAKGFDITSIGIDAPGIQDNEVMETAIREKRVILTFDRDYGTLIFQHNYKPEAGVIYLRLRNYDAIVPGKLVENLLSNSELDIRNALTVVDEHGIRQRKY